ncbi:MAG: hypothetical protein AAF548_14095 [Actinomycetota bacterium]
MARIGIVLCDHFDDDVEQAAGAALPDLHIALLRGADPDLDFTVFDAVAGELPGRDDRCDGYLVTGSRADAFADDLWILDLLAWIEEAHSRAARIIGVCFGHQAVARSLGGRVERAPGWKVGPHRLDLDATPWFPSTSVHINAMHRDVVTSLPDDATPLGTGSTAAIAAYRIGDTIIAVQDHPEYAAEITGHLIRRRRDMIGGSVADEGLERLADVPTDGDVCAGLMVDFLLDRRRS